MKASTAQPDVRRKADVLAHPRRLRILLARVFRYLYRALSDRRTIRGIVVYEGFDSREQAAAFRPMLEDALTLLAEHHSRTLHRVRQHSIGLIVFDHPRLYGSWHAPTREIRISPSPAARLGAPALAATIVHEATHAWLTSLGIEDRPERRHRVEAICYRTQAVFARRLPDAEDLSRAYEELAVDAETEGPAPFGPAARIERELQALKAFGTPEWLVRLVGWVARRTSA